MATDLRTLYRDPSYQHRVYFLMHTETIGPSDDRLTVTKWGRHDNPRTRRYQVHDSGDNELYDTDDCYDGGNALFKLDQWLAEYERRYDAKHAADAASKA